jgi:hypothetical protein
MYIVSPIRATYPSPRRAVGGPGAQMPCAIRPFGAREWPGWIDRRQYYFYYLVGRGERPGLGVCSIVIIMSYMYLYVAASKPTYYCSY